MKSYSIGNGYTTNGLRLYKDVRIGSKSVKILISWTQKRCIKCGRFLGKHGLKYCKRCLRLQKSMWDYIYKIRHKEQCRIRDKIYYQQHKYKWRKQT